MMISDHLSGWPDHTPCERTAPPPPPSPVLADLQWVSQECKANTLIVVGGSAHSLTNGCPQGNQHQLPRA